MSEYYLPLRQLHIGSALLSVIVFLSRGLLALSGANMSTGRALRILPHVLDTVLLASAVALTVTTGQFPFRNDWLTAKILLLVLYIVFGSLALKRGRTRSIRAAAFLAATVTVLLLLSVARAHHPLGIFAIHAP